MASPSGTVIVALSVRTMSVMHEVHQGTCQKKEIGQNPEQVSSVFSDQEEACNGEEADQCHAKRPPPPLRFGFGAHQ